VSGYLITIATIIAINGIVACGLNVIVGFAGQISLGHAAFFGIGAYTAALLATQTGLSFWAALPCVIAMSALIGLLLGIPSLRVRERLSSHHHHRHQLHRGAVFTISSSSAGAGIGGFRGWRSSTSSSGARSSCIYASFFWSS